MKAISACLCGVCCSYNGKSHEKHIFKEMVENNEAIMICPEVLGGLNVPRTPAERINNRILTELGEDVTDAYLKGAQKAVELCKEYQVTEVILKAKSPSCGVNKIYDGTFSHTVIEGHGVTAELLLKEGFTVISDEDYLQEDIV